MNLQNDNLNKKFNELKIDTNNEIKKDKIIAYVRGKEVAVAYAVPGKTPQSINGMKFLSVTEFYNYAAEIEDFMKNYPFIATD